MSDCLCAIDTDLWNDNNNNKKNIHLEIEAQRDFNLIEIFFSFIHLFLFAHV